MIASLWDEEDGFFYDNLHFSDGQHLRVKVRSMVGLMIRFVKRRPRRWRVKSLVDSLCRDSIGG